MSVEIEFPFEFVVAGTALSMQAKLPTRIEAWKEQIRSAARPLLPEGHWACPEPVQVTIYCFPDRTMDGDLDNIVKPILDALSRFMYLDDKQVERLLIQKFEPMKAVEFVHPSPTLEKAALFGGPRLYIKINLAPTTIEVSGDV